MKGLDLADLVALAGEVCEVDGAKLVELLDTPEADAVLAGAQPPHLPHEAAAALIVGIMAVDPLPAGTRPLALLSAVHLLRVNGLGADLDAPATRALLAEVAAGREDTASVATWLDPQVTALDPLEGELRGLLSPDAWRAIDLAVVRASRHGRRLAGPEDLLLGLFREGTGPAARALGSEGRGMEVVARPLRAPVPARLPAFTPEARKVLELAFRAAVGHGHGEITGAHLLIGLLDGGHGAVLPEGLEVDDVRSRVVELLPPDHDDDLARRLARLVALLRSVDAASAAELEEIADLQRIGLDRVIEMIRAWRGEIFLDFLAGEPVVARLLGPQRLEGQRREVLDQRLLAKYLAGIAGHARLTRADEVELAESIRADVDSADAAAGRRRLVEANLHLVVSIARTYEGSGVSLLELVQEGNAGLARAAERFDPTKGYRFASYATWWIRRSMLEAVDGRR